MPNSGGMAEEIPMSVRRLVAAVDVSTTNVSAFCAEHGLSRWSFYEIRKRVAAEGEAGLVLRSRAPKVVANRTPAHVEDAIVALRKDLIDAGLDAGPATIRWHLTNQLDEGVPSESTIWRILKVRGFIVPDPSKAPRGSRSFQAERANEVWQIDGTGWELAGGDEVKIVNTIDDCSRVLISSQAHLAESFDAVWSTVLAGASRWGWPQRFLADNGKANKKLGKPLGELGIEMGHSRPYHPQTCGKVERFHQTLKKWLEKQPLAWDLPGLQSQLDDFADIYNHQRPHRGIGRQIPAQVWHNTPRSGPANSALSTPTTLSERTVNVNGIINASGKRISIGSSYSGQTATTIITGTNGHVFIEGQLIRKLTINPNTTSHPLHPRRGRPKNQK